MVKSKRLFSRRKFTTVLIGSVHTAAKAKAQLALEMLKKQLMPHPQSDNRRGRPENMPKFYRNVNFLTIRNSLHDQVYQGLTRHVRLHTTDSHLSLTLVRAYSARNPISTAQVWGKEYILMLQYFFEWARRLC